MSQNDGNVVGVVCVMCCVLSTAESLVLDAVLSVGTLQQWQGLSGRGAVLGRV
jgi:hypothetical protein